MRPFNLKEYLDNPNLKIVDKDGNPVPFKPMTLEEVTEKHDSGELKLYNAATELFFAEEE